MKVILASKSPRRSELLSQVGMDFTVVVSDADENIDIKNPSEFVMELSKIKGMAVYEKLCNENDDIVVIGADTVVVLGDKILGKPKNDDDAFNTLKELSNNVHKVMTGVSLIYRKNGEVKIDTFYEETKVYMYDVSDAEIKEYLSTGEHSDKAGSYAIQGIAGKFIEKIEGDYNNVVGLPVARLYQRMKGI